LSIPFSDPMSCTSMYPIFICPVSKNCDQADRTGSPLCVGFPGQVALYVPGFCDAPASLILFQPGTFINTHHYIHALDGGARRTFAQVVEPCRQQDVFLVACDVYFQHVRTVAAGGGQETVHDTAFRTIREDLYEVLVLIIIIKEITDGLRAVLPRQQP